jgi:hypothetical protein
MSNKTKEIYKSKNTSTFYNVDTNVIEWSASNIPNLPEWKESLLLGIKAQIENNCNKWLNDGRKMQAFGCQEQIHFVNQSVNDFSAAFFKSCKRKQKIAFINSEHPIGKLAIHAYVCCTKVLYSEFCTVEVFETREEAYSWLLDESSG